MEVAAVLVKMGVTAGEAVRGMMPISARSAVDMEVRVGQEGLVAVVGMVV